MVGAVVTRNLDTSGTACPMPAFKTKKEIGGLQPGDQLVVTGDFPPAVENITRVARQAGCTVVREVIDGGTFTIVLEKQ